MAAHRNDNIPIEELIKRDSDVPVADMDGYDEVILDGDDDGEKPTDAKPKIMWKSAEPGPKRSGEGGAKESDGKRPRAMPSVGAKTQPTPLMPPPLSPADGPKGPRKKATNVATAMPSEPDANNDESPVKPAGPDRKISPAAQSTPTPVEKDGKTPKADGHQQMKESKKRDKKPQRKEDKKHRKKKADTETTTTTEVETKGTSEPSKKKKKKGCCTIA